MKTIAQHETARNGQNIPRSEAEWQKRATVLLTNPESEAIWTQAGVLVRVEVYNLQGEAVHLEHIELDQWAEFMQWLWRMDAKYRSRRFYRCICGEWTFETLTPKGGEG